VNGWFRDFLWAQSSQVLTSYGSGLSVYGLLFLGLFWMYNSLSMVIFYDSWKIQSEVLGTLN
jgi:photosystem I P700 chlorophyll a apoprotein A1